MARYSKQVAKAYQDVSVGDYYVDSDGHWLTLKEGYSRMGGRIVHEGTARDMLEARKEVEADAEKFGRRLCAALREEMSQ